MYLRSSISMIGITLGLSFSVLAQPPDRTLTCSSADGRRTVCQVDTRNGVLLSRQLGTVRCVEGYNWGYSEEGIWVNRGCQAEFVVQGRERPRNWERNTRLEAGTIIPVRVDQSITSERADGRIFTGVVDQDVVGTNGRLAIPRGSNVELIVRAARDGDLILDLESVVVVGQRYALDAQVERVESTRSGGVNRRTGEFAGGGAVLGAIIGAIAGGGKGAAIGAGAGAAAGLTTDVVTRGKRVRIPAESVLTFRLDSGLVMGVADSGTIRDGWHYHNEPKQ